MYIYIYIYVDGEIISSDLALPERLPSDYIYIYIYIYVCVCVCVCDIAVSHTSDKQYGESSTLYFSLLPLS